MSHENLEGTEPSKQEYTPEELAKMREHEDQEIRDFVEKIKSTIDLDNPARNLVFTAMEHKLIGSTSPGRGFYPNAPLAHFAGSTIERINAMREKYSGKNGIDGFYAEIDLDSKKWIEFAAKLKPLSEEIINSEHPTPTVEVARVNMSYDKSITTLDDADLQKKMDAAQADRRAALKEEFESPDDSSTI